MIIGNAAWGLREIPLERQLEITAAMKLPLLELSIANYHRDRLQLDSRSAEIRAVSRLFESFGVSPECGATGNDFTGDNWKQQLANVKRVIEIAADVGIKKLRIFAGFSSDSVVIGERLDNMLSALAEIAKFAAGYGVVPTVETHGGVTAVGDAVVHYASASTRVDILEKIVATGAALNYDPANLAAAGSIDPAAFFTKFSAHIQSVHLKDFRAVPGGVVPTACGEGILDWPLLLKTLENYGGPALIEYELTGDVEDGLKRSLEFLRTSGVK